MAAHLPAPDAPIPDVDPTCTLTLDELYETFYTHLAPVHDINPHAPSFCLSFRPFTATAYSYPSNYSLPPSPRPARSASPAPSSSYSRYCPRDPDESYFLLPNEPYTPVRRDWFGFGVAEPERPISPKMEGSGTTSPSDPGSSSGGGPSSRTHSNSSTGTNSPTPPTSPSDSTSPTDSISSIRPKSPIPPTASIRPRSPSPPTASVRPNSPPPLTPPTTTSRPLYPYPIRPARPILPIAQPPSLPVSELDPEIIALAVAKTFERMESEHRVLYHKWIAFRDAGVTQEAFILKEEMESFSEGHRAVWREIQKRGVNSDLWNLPPAPPLPGTLPPHGESLAHGPRARYLAALNAHKAWRRTLRCSDPARLNTYEDTWYPQNLVLARMEILEANPWREMEQDVFRRREERFAMLQLRMVRSLRARGEFWYVQEYWGMRKKGWREVARDVRKAGEKALWGMERVRVVNRLQAERERREMEEREERIQELKDRAECGAEFWTWFTTLAWMCRGRWQMPVLRYGMGTVNTAEIPCLVEAVAQVASWWEDAYPVATEEGYEPMGEAVPLMWGALAEPFIPAGGYGPMGEAVPLMSGALAEPFIPAGGYGPMGETVPLMSGALAEPFVPANGYEPMVQAIPLMSGALPDPFDPPLDMAAALAEPFVPASDAFEKRTLSPIAEEESVLSGSEDGVAIAEPFVPAGGYEPMAQAVPLMSGALPDPFDPPLDTEPFVPASDAFEKRTLSPIAEEESAQDGVAIADFPPPVVPNTTVTPQSPQHEEFMRRCSRSGVVVTTRRTGSPVVQDGAPSSGRQ